MNNDTDRRNGQFRHSQPEYAANGQRPPQNRPTAPKTVRFPPYGAAIGNQRPEPFATIDLIEALEPYIRINGYNRVEEGQMSVLDEIRELRQRMKASKVDSSSPSPHDGPLAIAS